jgi:hypothetical protein
MTVYLYIIMYIELKEHNMLYSQFKFYNLFQKINLRNSDMRYLGDRIILSATAVLYNKA